MASNDTPSRQGPVTNGSAGETPSVRVPGASDEARGSGIERRDFLKVLGVAGAGAALTGCSDAPDRLLPYVIQQEDVVPGMSTYYRTTCRECPAGCGMTVRTREGRALKAEGSAASPISHGKLCARGQASLHGVYDPDRVPQALVRDAGRWTRVSWDRAEQSLADALGSAAGEAVFLTRPEAGSMDALLDEWCGAMGVRRVKFESFSHGPIRAAYGALYGREAIPIHDFSQAEVVVTFGADFMETWLSPVDYAHGWVESHAYANGRRGRLISVTPHQSLTDLNADEWLPARAGTEHLVALAMARLVGERTGLGGAALGMLPPVDPARAAEAAGVPLERIVAAAEVFANGGRSLAVGPGVGTTGEAATTLALAVAVLNEAAGNVGRAVRPGPAPEGLTSYREMAALVEDMAAGRVSILLVHGPNPLYDLPDRARVEAALSQVPLLASFSPWLDDTAARAHVVLPDHHFLEAWGDYEPRPGVHSLIQPVMTPVFDTKQTGDVLLSVARRAGAPLTTRATTFYDYLRERWHGVQARAGDGGSFDVWWTQALSEGVVVLPENASGATAAAPGAGGIARLTAEPAPLAGDGEFALVVYPSYRFYDGRLANRPWLQELPDPISKHTWGTVLEIHPRAADDLGLDDGHIVTVTTPNGSLELPVWRHPGMREDTIAIQLGQGHEHFGRYARDRGVNPTQLLAPAYDAPSGTLAWIQVRAAVTPTGRWERQPFSSTQETESGRDIIEKMTLQEAIAADGARGAGVAGAVAHGGAAGVAPAEGTEAGAGTGVAAAEESEGVARTHAHREAHPMEETVWQLQGSGGFAPVPMGAAPQDYPPPGTHYGEYTEAVPRWGMAIDLERCIGCSACQTACQAENNIGMVGPELVAQGRLIQWMRIERYFELEEDGTPRGTNFLPMLCQQCGNAPCEPVCPVYASYHTPDGLNGQVYNRCVGTRYCANNCPYKVRYFNFFSYEWPEPLNWQLNPDVTVREKGIMEKCTFCVQRIRETERRARVDGRVVRDGEIVPACAQTCPGNAIVFGDMKNPESRVVQVALSGRGFRVFDELNTQSAIVYLQPVVTHATEGAED